MIYEAALLGGAGWLAYQLLEDQMKEPVATAPRSSSPARNSAALATTRRLQRRLMSEQEKWDLFVKIKAAHEKDPSDKELENLRIEAERRLQAPSKGFYVGDGAEVGLEPGKATRQPIFFPWKNLYNHYIFFGTTRFGKTRALANHMRQFIENGYNVIVIDPKGGENQEILAWAVQFAAENNRLDDFMFYNPVFPELTDYFNPLFGKSNDEIASEMEIYAKGDPNSKDDFFTKRVPQVIKAIAAAAEYLDLIRDPDGVRAQAAMEMEVRRYLQMRVTNGHKVKIDKENFIMKPDVAYRSGQRITTDLPIQSKPDTINRKLMTFKDFAHYADFDNLVGLENAVKSATVPVASKNNQRLNAMREEALMQLNGAKNGDKEQYNKTTATLVELLNKLATGSIGRMFCTTAINPMILRQASEDRGVIAVVQPNPLKYQGVSDMIMKIFLKNFESTFGNLAANGRVFNKRTIVIIDEASKAMFPGIEELFNKLGGIGLSLGLYTQSQADLILTLGADRARVIMDNINTVAYMKTNDELSRELASKAFGQRKITDYQMQAQGGVGGMARSGVTFDMQDLAHMDTFDKLGIGEGLIRHYGRKYFVQFPYQPSPSGYIQMPKLENENTIEELIRFQKDLEERLRYRETREGPQDEVAA